jgi:hypothetical protein
MKHTLSILILLSGLISGCTHQIRFSGNPVFPGWYADPEGIIYNRRFWIFTRILAEWTA